MRPAPKKRVRGAVYKPKHGPLRTRVERRGTGMQWPFGLMPREGAGDFRHGVAGLKGPGTGPGGDLSADHRSTSEPLEFIPIRNGLPLGTPYVYRAPRPAWATRGLDLAAIAAADREMERGSRKQEAASKITARQAVRFDKI